MVSGEECSNPFVFRWEDGVLLVHLQGILDVRCSHDWWVPEVLIWDSTSFVFAWYDHLTLGYIPRIKDAMYLGEPIRIFGCLQGQLMVVRSQVGESWMSWLEDQQPLRVLVWKEWVIGNYGLGMRNVGSRFRQDISAKKVAIRCMWTGIQESSSREEDFGQGSHCSQWLLSEASRNRSRGI